MRQNSRIQPKCDATPATAKRDRSSLHGLSLTVSSVPVMHAVATGSPTANPPTTPPLDDGQGDSDSTPAC